MKARIKSTGDILPIAPYAKITLDVCDDRGTPYEVDFEDVELINEDESAGKSDWSSFRREAAKDILASISKTFISIEDAYLQKGVALSIKLADELIKQLQEK